MTRSPVAADVVERLGSERATRVRRGAWLDLAMVVGLAAAGCDDGGGFRDRDARRDPGTRDASTRLDADTRDAATAAGSSDAAASGSDAGLDAALDDDAGLERALCVPGECDLVDPLSCEPPQGCVLLLARDDPSMVSGQCASVGDGRDGEPCDSYTQCGPGLDCTGPGGACRRYCCELNQVAGCPAGQFCRVALTSGGGEATGAALCDRCDECELLDPDGCPDALGCYALPGAERCEACLPEGEVPVGEPCARANDCAAGAGCFALDDDASGASRCVAYCALDAPDACAMANSGAGQAGAGQATCQAVLGIELPDATGLCL